MEKIVNLFSAVGSKKRIIMLLLVAVVGILCILFGGNGGAEKPKSEETDSYYSVRYYTEEMEERIESLCCQISGVKEAHVLLTMDGSSEYIYAENEADAARDYVIIEGDGSDSPVHIQEIYPKIRGVAVVCTKGGDSEMQRTITELLSAALGIPSSRIRVAGT